MNKSTSNHIDQLLLDSGLFPNKRKPKKLSNNFDFSNETILITGAAGSIGSELSKQLISTKFNKLILVDIAESPLYDLMKELEFVDTNSVEFIIFNITDDISLRKLFETYKPTVIFHTAAYKHVPLMEDNPYEAVKLNILGTKLLADLSIEFDVKKFVFISTDKAVKPISVMGITKYIAERYLNKLSLSSKTIFLITRFGNILGSNGSVLPLLKKQIEIESPITITDKLASRYFISKYKACYLILKIATLNKESSTYAFNMGEPIKIVDLVERLLQLYEINGNAIKMKITGLRPGEKLHEEMIEHEENLAPTNDDDILLVNKKEHSQIKSLDFDKLFSINPYLSNNEIKLLLKSYL
ncbi:polysaccharide biosynthesis protein [Sabulilitoribacter multivorans]|uniref:Polysaccharide biosynthesis protein n=1 Tax=Flaviramulus multivorans TaxID=1304750 RepID=A0ABS9IJJ6_9FLAO|nr:SDR family NAD(P)-dependent oxidoreductase [Flaviramulus multivorans]MCF7560761.1 polysaccharide biosynthesis protein [Flaviramulus multivorans]